MVCKVVIEKKPKDDAEVINAINELIDKHPLQDLFEPNMDFMSHTLYNGKRYRILNIMDEFKVETSLPSVKILQALSRAVDFRGKPQSI